MHLILYIDTLLILEAFYGLLAAQFVIDDRTIDANNWQVHLLWWGTVPTYWGTCPSVPQLGYATAHALPFLPHKCLGVRVLYYVK